MAKSKKLYRGSLAPPGADEPLRNRRLYGDRESQIEGMSLRSRGTPNPNRAIVTRPRAELVIERDTRDHRAHLQRAQDRMLAAQREVRAARLAGDPTTDLAVRARALRAEYLKLTGGTDRRAVELAVHASSWDEAK